MPLHDASVQNRLAVWHNHGVSTPRRPTTPLDAAALERLALRYVERYATTRAKLSGYLIRKIRERGAEGPLEPEAVAERMAELGYVDDRGFAEARAAAMGRRGLGARRIAQALDAVGVDKEDRAGVAALVAEQAVDSALRFARRRRIGPYGPPAADMRARERQIGAMLRAGHAFDLAKRIVDARDEYELDDFRQDALSQ